MIFFYSSAYGPLLISYQITTEYIFTFDFTNLLFIFLNIAGYKCNYYFTLYMLYTQLISVIKQNKKNIFCFVND